MKAAVFWGSDHLLTIEEVEIDRPMAQENVVRTVASVARRTSFCLQAVEIGR